MALVAKHGIPSMKWEAPKDNAEVESLFEEWGQDQILLKRTLSNHGQGLDLVDRNNLKHTPWNPGDVFCQLIDSPTVYKLHFLGEKILGGYRIDMPPARELEKLKKFLKPQVEALVLSPEFLQKHAHSDFTLTPQTAAQVAALGKDLLGKGIAYGALDLMEWNGDLVVIELNVNSVGTYRGWTLWPDRFQSNLERALRKFVEFVRSSAST